MKHFIFLTILCSLALGMGAQTAKEEIFADVHRSAANYYAYPVPSVEQTAPPTGYKPFYLSHYARHGSRFLINPDDYEKPLAVMREADGNGVLTELGKKTLCISYGPSPLTKGEIPFMESNLLANILDTADTCIVKKENSATLRFGHESCLLPLACLLELGDCAYQTTDLSTLDETWRNYKVFPMAGNIQFVFFRKRGNDDILVKVLLNEHEMKLPVESELAPYYRWKDVETYYRNKLAAYKK